MRITSRMLPRRWASRIGSAAGSSRGRNDLIGPRRRQFLELRIGQIDHLDQIFAFGNLLEVFGGEFERHGGAAKARKASVFGFPGTTSSVGLDFQARPARDAVELQAVNRRLRGKLYRPGVSTTGAEYPGLPSGP